MLLVAMLGAPSSVLAPTSVLVRSGAPSSFLFLVCPYDPLYLSNYVHMY